jgi:hypothetical protein
MHAPKTRDVTLESLLHIAIKLIGDRFHFHVAHLSKRELNNVTFHQNRTLHRNPMG